MSISNPDPLGFTPDEDAVSIDSSSTSSEIDVLCMTPGLLEKGLE